MEGRQHPPIALDDFADPKGERNYRDADSLRAMLEWAGSERALSIATGIARSTLHSARTSFGIEISDLNVDDAMSEKARLMVEASELRRKASDREAAAYRKYAARSEMVAQSVREAVRALPVVPRVTPLKLDTSASNLMSPVSQVVHFSDWHFGEVVEPSAIMDMNEYNIEIACRRLHRLERSILIAKSVIERAHPVEELVILMLGDMGSGRIHDELIETNETDAYGEWALSSLVTAQFIARLAAHYPKVVVRGVPGNHGRMSKERRFKASHVNWDHMMYQTVSMMLALQPNVECEFPQSPFQLFDVQNSRYLAYHGSEIKSWMGIPWYGINRAVAQLRELLQGRNDFFDYVALAHFHTAGQLDRAKGKVLLNGSVIGGSEYSIGAIFASSHPSQRVYFVHPEHGKVWEMENDLSKGDAEDHPYIIDVGSNLGQTVKSALYA